MGAKLLTQGILQRKIEVKINVQERSSLNLKQVIQGQWR